MIANQIQPLRQESEGRSEISTSLHGFEWGNDAKYEETDWQQQTLFLSSAPTVLDGSKIFKNWEINIIFCSESTKHSFFWS